MNILSRKKTFDQMEEKGRVVQSLKIDLIRAWATKKGFALDDDAMKLRCDSTKGYRKNQDFISITSAVCVVELQ